MPPKKPTRQLQISDSIAEYRQRRGFSPKVQEMADGLVLLKRESG
jgi:hypothetical protein